MSLFRQRNPSVDVISKLFTINCLKHHFKVQKVLEWLLENKSILPSHYMVKVYLWVKTDKDLCICLRKSTLSTQLEYNNNLFIQWIWYTLADIEKRRELWFYLRVGVAMHYISDWAWHKKMRENGDLQMACKSLKNLLRTDKTT